MEKITYQTFPIADSELSPEAVELFHRLKLDMNLLLEKIRDDAMSDDQIDLNSAIEEAYLRSLVVAGVLIPLRDNLALCVDESNQIH
jgi:hypothetical protein